jgi:hypothetical protein
MVFLEPPGGRGERVGDRERSRARRSDHQRQLSVPRRIRAHLRTACGYLPPHRKSERRQCWSLWRDHHGYRRCRRRSEHISTRSVARSREGSRSASRRSTIVGLPRIVPAAARFQLRRCRNVSRRSDTSRPSHPGLRRSAGTCPVPKDCIGIRSFPPSELAGSVITRCQGIEVGNQSCPGCPSRLDYVFVPRDTPAASSPVTSSGIRTQPGHPTTSRLSRTSSRTV